jgi:hypothetical protein
MTFPPQHAIWVTNVFVISAYLASLLAYSERRRPASSLDNRCKDLSYISDSMHCVSLPSRKGLSDPPMVMALTTVVKSVSVVMAVAQLESIASLECPVRFAPNARP